ncbi:MAG: hypothetical protein HY647_00850 [Acidobacteria bacterium]|nr:hypothetical protein [Acidobacteriota bacterium]
MRKIEGQKTRLGRTMHAIVYDEIHDEFFVPVPFPQAILAFRGGANGEEAPIRVIQGPLTQLNYPDRLAVDPVNNEIFVPQDDEVLVFPRGGNGSVAPVRVLKGPDTQLGASALAVDAIHNLLIVGGRGRQGERLLIFNRTDQGNAKPKASIGGPKSGLLNIGGPFAVYPPTGKIVVSVRGGSVADLVAEDSFVGVWSIYDNGDVPPQYRIGGPRGVLKMVRGVTLNPKHKELIVSDKRLNSVMTFYLPEIF